MLKSIHFLFQKLMFSLRPQKKQNELSDFDSQNRKEQIE